MSILAITDPPPLPDSPGDTLLVYAIGMIVALIVGALLKVHCGQRVLGPQRLSDGRPAWLLLPIVFAAAALWMGAQGAYIASRQSAHQRGGATRPFQVEDLTAGDFAVLSVFPGLMATAVIVAGASLVRRGSLAELGLRARNLPRGLLAAAVAMLVVLPLVMTAALGAERIYEWVGYEHPNEHDLLRHLGQSSGMAIRIGLVIGAVLVAPLWEEIFFRGFLQTLLIRGVELMTGPSPAIGEEAIPPPAARQSVLIAWLGIALTSIVFTLFHPAWSWPPLLILSLCLGYAYERTGNLWVPMGMHLLFNGFSTALYLAMQP